MDYPRALKLGTTKQFDFFNFQKKDESISDDRGYSRAIAKCNKKMRRILSYMSDSYHLAMRDDDDDDF